MFVGRGFGLNCAVNCNTTLILLFYTLPSTYTLRPPFSSTTHLFVLSQRRVYRFIPPPPRANSSAHNLCGPQGVVLMSKASSSIMARSVAWRATGVGCSATSPPSPPPCVLPLRRRVWCPAARCAFPRRRLGRDDALALLLVGLPVAALVLPRAVPNRLARRALPLRPVRAEREPTLHECRILPLRRCVVRRNGWGSTVEVLSLRRCFPFHQSLAAATFRVQHRVPTFGSATTALQPRP